MARPRTDVGTYGQFTYTTAHNGKVARPGIVADSGSDSTGHHDHLGSRSGCHSHLCHCHLRVRGHRG